MVSISDIQNYMFSFFGGVYFPSTDDLSVLKEEIRKDLGNGTEDN